MDATEIQRRTAAAVGDLRAFGRRITDKPVAALLTAVAAGFVLGLVLRFFERPKRVEK